MLRRGFFAGFCFAEANGPLDDAIPSKYILDEVNPSGATLGAANPSEQTLNNYLSVEQVAREFFVNTNTINAWIRKGRIEPSASFSFGNRTIHLFSPGDVATIRERMQIPVHDDSTIHDDFFDFLEKRDNTMSYKMPFVLALLDHMDSLTGSAAIDDVLADYTAFYKDRLDRGLVVDRAGCPYDERMLADARRMRRSMLDNPFEKFERKRFMYYSRDLGQISLNHALLASLSAGDLDTIRAQMHADLDDYYARL